MRGGVKGNEAALPPLPAKSAGVCEVPLLTLEVSRGYLAGEARLRGGKLSTQRGG